MDYVEYLGIFWHPQASSFKSTYATIDLQVGFVAKPQNQVVDFCGFPKIRGPYSTLNSRIVIISPIVP